MSSLSDLSGNLAVIKNKIIATDEVLKLLAEKNIQLNKTKKLYNKLQLKYAEKSIEIDQVQKRLEDVQFCSGEYITLRKEFVALKSQYNTAAKAHDEYINSAQVKYQNACLEVEELNKKCAELEKKASTGSAEFSSEKDLKKLLKSANRKVNAKEEIIAELKKKNKTLNEDHQRCLKSLEQIKCAKVEKLSVDANFLNDKNLKVQLEKRVENLKNELQTTRDELESMKIEHELTINELIKRHEFEVKIFKEKLTKLELKPTNNRSTQTDIDETGDAYEILNEFIKMPKLLSPLCDSSDESEIKSNDLQPTVKVKSFGSFEKLKDQSNCTVLEIQDNSDKLSEVSKKIFRPRRKIVKLRKVVRNERNKWIRFVRNNKINANNPLGNIFGTGPPLVIATPDVLKSYFESVSGQCHTKQTCNCNCNKYSNFQEEESRYRRFLRKRNKTSTVKQKIKQQFRRQRPVDNLASLNDTNIEMKEEIRTESNMSSDDSRCKFYNYKKDKRSRYKRILYSSDDDDSTVVELKLNQSEVRNLFPIDEDSHNEKIDTENMQNETFNITSELNETKSTEDQVAEQISDVRLSEYKQKKLELFGVESDTDISVAKSPVRKKRKQTGRLIKKCAALKKSSAAIFKNSLNNSTQKKLTKLVSNRKLAVEKLLHSSSVLNNKKSAVEVKAPEQLENTLHKPENIRTVLTSEKLEVVYKRPERTKFLPPCPRSPNLLERVTEEPKIIPLERVQPLELKAQQKLVSDIVTSDWNENLMQTVINSLSEQDSLLVARIIVHKAAEDFSQELDKTYTPPAPMMTVTQQKLLVLLCRLEDSGLENIYKKFLDIAEQKLLSESKLEVVYPLTRLYVAACKLKYDIEQVRILCCNAAYYMGDLLLPFMFIVLTMWAEVLPTKEQSKDVHLAPVLVQVIKVKNCKTPGYNAKNLNGILTNYYGYEYQAESSDDIMAHLVEAFRGDCSKLVFTAILILFKNLSSKWTCKQIKLLLMPIVQNNFKDESKSLLISNTFRLIGRVLEPVNAIEIGTEIQEILHWVQSFLSESCQLSNDVKQSIAFCLSVLSNLST